MPKVFTKTKQTKKHKNQPKNTQNTTQFKQEVVDYVLHKIPLYL